MLASVPGESCAAATEERAERVPGAFLADLAQAGVSLAQEQLANHFHLQAIGETHIDD